MPALMPPPWLDENLIDPADIGPHGATWHEVDQGLEDRWIRLVADDLQGQLLQCAPAAEPAENINRIGSLERLIATAQSVLAAEAVAFAAAEKQRQIAARGENLRPGPRHCGATRLRPPHLAGRCRPASRFRDRPAPAAPGGRGPVPQRRHLRGQARIAVTRTCHLSDTDALLVDAGIAPRIAGWNLAGTEKAVDHACYASDPQGFVDRARHASTERRVWVRPAPDSMSIVSALLPVAEGVAVYATCGAQPKP